MAPHARGVAVVPVGDDRFLLRRGVTQLLVSGAEAGLATVLVDLLDGTRDPDEVLAALPDSQRPAGRKLVDALSARRLLAEDEEDDGALDADQHAFYANFGAQGRAAYDALAAVHVLVHGSGTVARQLVAAALGLGVGRISVVAAGAGWTDDNRVHVFETLPEALDGVDLLVATDDHGREEALARVGRAALAAGCPFLPVWLSDLVGYVGPLTYPYETACLRCYLLRVDSNAKDLQVRRALRANGDGSDGAGFLPPMAAVVAQIAAVQLLLTVTGLRTPDAAGQSIEISLVSFRSTVRRVLKVPRCPDCGAGQRHGSRVIVTGPQITE